MRKVTSDTLDLLIISHYLGASHPTEVGVERKVSIYFARWKEIYITEAMWAVQDMV